MDKGIRDQIITHCNEFSESDYVESFSKNLTEGQSLESLRIGSFNGVSIIPIIQRTITQLKNELESDNYIFLPNQFLNSGGGIVNLLNEVKNFYNYLITSNYAGLWQSLQTIISYQIVHGFWDRSRVNLFSVDEIKLHTNNETLKVTAEIIQKNLEKIKNDGEQKITEFKKEIENIKNLVDSKKSEFDSITALYQNSQTTVQSISDILTTAKDNVQKNETTFTKLITNSKNLFDQQTKESVKINSELDKLTNENSSASKVLSEIKEQKESIDKSLQEIDEFKRRVEEVTGLITEKGLTHSFASRASELKKSTNLWFGFIWIGFVISGMWLTFAFTCLPNYLENSNTNSLGIILFLIVASAKIFPVWVLMQFIFKQYGRERQLWEGYEFKKAVSATVLSFADQLINEKFSLSQKDFMTSDGKLNDTAWKTYSDDRDKARRNLIDKTVSDLYKEVVVSNPEKRQFKLSNKDWQKIKDMMAFTKEMTDNVRQVTK